MSNALKIALPLLLIAAPAAAQELDPVDENAPVTRQTATRDTPLLDFEYSWPQAVNDEPALVETFNDDLARTYEEGLDNARENKAETEKVHAPFNQNMFSRIWSLEGETRRFYSLLAATDTFTGGAHPNHTSSALLWDRSTDQQVEIGSLFSAADGLETVVRKRFCELLDKERSERRQGEVLDGEFSECPAFSELTILPAGGEASAGKFDSIKLIADPYVAGPYVEGEYAISVPVSTSLIDALKPEFRSDFAAQGTQ